jgi:hypothetical protein
MPLGPVKFRSSSSESIVSLFEVINRFTYIFEDAEVIQTFLEFLSKILTCVILF